MANDINNMTRKEFDALPESDWNNDIGTFTSLVVLPTRRKHDSGYRCMDFVAVKDGEAMCRLSGCSDVIHINGIGGMGGFDTKAKTWDLVKGNLHPSWSIDCLPKSGLLHLFCSYKIRAGSALSSFEIFADLKNRRG